ncbi:MAG: hypothetical protein JW751_13130 [Polyangiaceae bacterium]|nr:hypothetical protein [Polyangiaceae bacterium]
MALAWALVLAARTATSAPPNHEAADAVAAFDAEPSMATEPVKVEVTLVGEAAQSPALVRSIDALARSEGITPRFLYLARLPRASLAEVAAQPGPGFVRVWVELPAPNSALLLIAAPAAQRYVVRELPLQNALDEVGREQIAQVVQSSTLALLRGDQGLDRDSMQRALAATANPSRPPTTNPSEGQSARAATRTAPTNRTARRARTDPGGAASFGKVEAGLSYSLAWTGPELEERHALGPTFRSIGTHRRQNALR